MGRRALNLHLDASALVTRYVAEPGSELVREAMERADAWFGKREPLVSAAAELLHRQGVRATTLTEIAEAADVPAGNVYYYFKTSEIPISYPRRVRRLEQWIDKLG